ncbi:neural cell adhesion molecule 1-like, partial [Saccoglossus kowalevskii]
PAFIYPEPNDSCAIQGQDMYLTCIAYGKPDTIIYKWYKDGVSLTQDESKYSIIDGSLLIKDVTQLDDAEYTCQAFNYIREDDEATAQLYIHYPPVVETEDKLFVREFQSLYLICVLTDGEPLPSTEAVKWKEPDDMLANRDNPLELTNIQRNQAGIYTCEVNNTLCMVEQGKGSSETIIIVEYGPWIVNGENNHHTASEGHNVTLDCIVDAVPHAEVLWSYETDEIIHTTENMVHDVRVINETHVHGYLHILNITSEQFGKYNCTGSNLYGEDTVIVILSVEDHEIEEPGEGSVGIIIVVFLLIILILAGSIGVSLLVVSKRRGASKSDKGTNIVFVP